MSEQVLTNLQNYMTQHYPDANISEFVLLSGGFECDIYAFKLLGDAPLQDLILRLYLGDDGAAKTQRESAGMRLLYRADYPVPDVLLSESDTSILGNAFVIMQKLDGQSLWGVMSSCEPEREDRLLKQFGQVVAQLHQVDWTAFTQDNERYQLAPLTVIDEWINSARQHYRKFDVAGFLSVCDWLDAHKTDISPELAVVHLDFHANNVLVDEEDNLTGIDWSQIAVTDYRCDLSWTLMIMGDNGKAGWRETILTSYEQAIGHPVDHLEYFDVMSYIKLLADTVISLKVGTEKLGMRSQDEKTREKQKMYLRNLSQRLYDIVGFYVPEVQAALLET